MLQLPRRLQSIDVFRAVTMFFMIFVNDVDGVTNIPGWIKHVDRFTDGLGFADTIFPAFLFIVGLSIPFALNKRMQSNESSASIAWHIITRSFALLVMGFFHVNLENYSDVAILPEPLFEIFITLAFFLIWLDYKPSLNKSKQNILQATGVIILIIMAVLYKGEKHGETIWLRPQWWGILGLIGWGYLTCGLVYLFAKGNLKLLVFALILFLTYNIISQTYLLDPVSHILKYCWFIGNGSEISLIMAGIIISTIYKRNIAAKKNIFLWLMFFLGGAMIAFGFITRPFGGISKIEATPAWVGICIGISIIIFAILIFLVDVKNNARWFKIIKPAGTSTLTCYLIPYFLYSFLELLHIYYPKFLSESIGGILRSFAIAFIVIFITGFLEKKNLRLKI
jgi:heparan-alpha-glucosaminide N-acetyltransferase